MDIKLFCLTDGAEVRQVALLSVSHALAKNKLQPRKSRYRWLPMTGRQFASVQLREDGVCRECGCTDDDCSGCVERTGQACSWVQADLCSACVPVKQAREKRKNVDPFTWYFRVDQRIYRIVPPKPPAPDTDDWSCVRVRDVQAVIDKSGVNTLDHMVSYSSAGEAMALYNARNRNRR